MDAGRGLVAILAGGGSLPLALAEHLAGEERPVRLIAFRGFADRATARRAQRRLDLLDVQGTLDTLNEWRPAAVALVGAVHRPRALAAMNVFSGFRNRAYVGQVLASGDDRLLSAVVKLFEEQGFNVEGVDRLAPSLLAQAGTLGSVEPSGAAMQAAARGLAFLDACAPFDVGQAAVICGERVVALEGPEGTDAMLDRVARLQRRSRLHRGDAVGVLVKTAKAGQDLRVDLPVVGPRTVARAAAAGLAGIVVGAGRTLVLDQAATVAAADRHGLFVMASDVSRRVEEAPAPAVVSTHAALPVPLPPVPLP